MYILQLSSLAIEQDMYNLQKECEEKDATIKELSTILHSSEVLGSKVQFCIYLYLYIIRQGLGLPRHFKKSTQSMVHIRCAAQYPPLDTPTPTVTPPTPALLVDLTDFLNFFLLSAEDCGVGRHNP